jgi:energy-coupling factor transporter ATP-binding protein EcfA2
MSVTSAINEELLAWFGDQPAWQNEAFRRILANGNLSASDQDGIHAFACRELKLEAGESADSVRLTENDLPTAPAISGPLPRLMALSALTNVNRLPSDQRLEFGPNLTIVYGHNAAGKSGYARVLKRACRCHEKAVERILPDVYHTPSHGSSAAAQFEVEADGSTETVNWTEGDAANPVLRRFVVFDSKVARSYLTERNLVTAVPPLFTKLELLGQAVKAVKERLSAAAAAARPSPVALKPYVDETAVGKLLGTMDGNTTRSTLEEALIWTPDDERLISDLEQQQARLKTEGPEALKRILGQRRQRIADLAAQLRGAEFLLTEEKVQAIQKQWRLCRELESQKQAAAKAALAKTEFEPVGTPAWEAVLSAAANYFSAEVEPGADFPGTPDVSRCVLCQRVLNGVAHDRLRSFWRFLQDDIAQRLRATQRQLRLMLDGLDNVPDETPAQLTVLAGEYAGDVPTIWPKVEDQFSELAKLRDAVRTATESGCWEEVPKPPPGLAADCDAQEEAVSAQIKALGDAAQAVAQLAALTKQIAELSSRKRAASDRDAILDHHARLVRSRQLQSASEQVSTQSISMKITTLQRRHVTEAFKAAVRGYAQDLGLKRALPEITSQTEAGTLSRMVGIDGVKVSGAKTEQVFSEGERTALALAYFLAELGEVSEVPGVILDDPVTSLDHRIRSKVVGKIVELARGRQVVVFTHDLAFYCELKEQATREAVPFEVRSIEAVGRFVGLVRNGEPLDAMSVVAREKFLEERIKEAQQAEAAGEVQRFHDICARFYSVLRATWERAVEELLFNKVVMRFEKEVKTMSLTGVVVDRDTICEVFGAMTKCSKVTDAHDHAAAENAPMPDSAEMKRDLEGLRAFRPAHKKKISKQQEDLKHLKG